MGISKVPFHEPQPVSPHAGSKYNLFLEDKEVFLLSSVKRKNNKTSNYLISLDKEDLNRDSGYFYGKLRSHGLCWV